MSANRHQYWVGEANVIPGEDCLPILLSLDGEDPEQKELTCIG